MRPLKRGPFGLAVYRLRIGEMHPFGAAPRKHVVINPFGIGVPFAKHRKLIALLHLKQPRLRRHIAFIAVIAIEMIRREVDERSGIAGKAVRDINLVT